LRKRAERHGDKAWIVTGRRSFTYGEMDQQSDRLARGLAGLGIAGGDTVLIMLPNAVEIILVWCALAKLGAIEVPVNTHLRGAVLAHIVNNSAATTLVVDRQYCDRLQAVGDQLSGLERLVVVAGDGDGDGNVPPPAWPAAFETIAFESLLVDGETPLPAEPRYRDLMAVMYTSGTTGPSKGVMITHAHAYEYALSVIELLEMTDEDVYYAPLPLFHIAELIEFLAPRMAYFMVPRYIDTVADLPKTQTGKIQKFALRARGLTETTWDREATGIKLDK